MLILSTWTSKIPLKEQINIGAIWLSLVLLIPGNIAVAFFFFFFNYKISFCFNFLKAWYFPVTWSFYEVLGKTSHKSTSSDINPSRIQKPKDTLITPPPTSIFLKWILLELWLMESFSTKTGCTVELSGFLLHIFFTLTLFLSYYVSHPV